jgi:hypothetical protein
MGANTDNSLSLTWVRIGVKIRLKSGVSLNYDKHENGTFMAVVSIRQIRTLLVAALLLLLAYAHPAAAQFLQQGPKLVGTGAVGNARQGGSVSLSADGNTAIVGGVGDNNQIGAAWVWTRSGAIWAQQGTTLVGSGAVGPDTGQGYSVALSADGNTAIVGGWGDNSYAGAAWVWTRSEGVWTQQGTKLVGSGAVGNARQGVSVSLSADGNTAIVGGWGDNSSSGAAWVWTRSGGAWTQQGTKLVGSGIGGPYATQGDSVSLSADGNTAIVGGGNDNFGAGAAWVWTRSGGVWTQQGTKLVGSGAVGNDVFQGAVSLSADGNTAIVGGFGDNNQIGAVWVWTRTGSVWTQQGKKLVGSGTVGSRAFQGESVSLSADGNTAIVGGATDSNNTGATWVWTRSGGVWTQQGTKLVGSGAVGSAQQGFSVSLSADGNTAIVGGSSDNNVAEAAWVFAAPAPAPSTSASSLSGTIYDQVTGLALPGVSVQLGTTIATSGNSGAYTLANLTAGDFNLALTKAGYSSASATLTVPASAKVTRNFTLAPLSAPSGGQGTIRVTGIRSKYSGALYFLDGLSFPVTFTANVDWAGHPPGVVRFVTPKRSMDVGASGGDATKQFDMGTDFGPGGRLQALAISGDGHQSAALVADLVVMPSIPSAALAVVDDGDHFHYASTLAFNLQFLNDGLPPGVSFNPDIPLFGDNPFDLEFTPAMQATVTGSHVDYAFQMSGSTNSPFAFKVAGQELDLAAQAGVSGDFDVPSRAWKWGGSLGVQANLDISKSWPFVVVIGPVPVPMYAKADLSLSADATLALLNLDPVTLNGTLALDPAVTGTLGVGLDSKLAVAGWIRGGADFTFQYPQTPPLQKYSLNLTMGVTVYAWLFKWDGPSKMWNWPSSGAGPQSLGLLNVPRQAGPVPYGRDYLNHPDYGRFYARSPRAALMGLAGAAAPKAQPAPLQTQVFPFSEPVSASSGTNFYLAWLYDDPNRSANNRAMLVFSRFNGAQWSAPAAVADDGTADFHPQMRVFADGSAMAVWENEGRVLPDNATFNDMMANLEISAAFFDPVTGQWQAATQLTTNSFLDCSPRIAGPTRNNLMLVWSANPGNDLEGGAAKPNQLWSAQWNGAAWSNPRMIASVPYPLLKYDLAYDGANARIVMSLDADNALTNVIARQLFEVSYQNGVWSGLQQLTSDAVPNDNPRMAIDPNGRFVLTWLKGGELSSVVDFNFANRQAALTNEYSSNLADFQLASGGDGRLAIVWAEPSANSSDLWAMFYDPVFQLWGNPRQLTDDPQTELGATAAFFGTNQLVAVYDRVDIDTATNQTGSVITNADLYVLQYQLSGDLALAANSLVSSPANPAPGSNVTLQVTAQNLGDQPVAGVSVVFYQGDPANGGIVIGQTNLSQPLRPGDSVTAGISWLVPATTNPVTIYAVIDPGQQFAGANRLNNEVAAAFVEPDLAVQSVTWSRITDNLLSVTARVINQGTLASGPATVDFRPNSATGTNLFETTLAGLAPGASTDVNYVWDVSTLGQNLTLCAVVTGATNSADFNLGNNVMMLAVQRAIAQINLTVGPILLLSGGSAQMTLTGLAGRNYLIQASTDLTNWVSVANVVLTNSNVQVSDPAAPSFSKRFYRAVTSP